MTNVVTFKKLTKDEILGKKSSSNAGDVANLVLQDFSKTEKPSVNIRINPLLKGVQLGSILIYLSIPFKTLIFGKNVEEVPNGTTGFPIKMEYFTEWYHEVENIGVIIKTKPLIPMLDQLKGVDWPLTIAILENKEKKLFDLEYRNACSEWLNNSIIIITD